MKIFRLRKVSSVSTVLIRFLSYFFHRCQNRLHFLRFFKGGPHENNFLELFQSVNVTKNSSVKFVNFENRIFVPFYFLINYRRFTNKINYKSKLYY